MNIIAVDPGGTTGWAGAVRQQEPFTWSIGQMPWEDAQDFLWNTVEQAGEHVTIVCERYSITMQTLKKARQYEALYVIGGLVLMTRRLNCSLVLQTPSEAKSFITDQKLKRLGWYDRTKGLDHGRDALRHLSLWAAKHGMLPAERFFE